MTSQVGHFRMTWESYAQKYDKDTIFTNNAENNARFSKQAVGSGFGSYATNTLLRIIPREIVK